METPLARERCRETTYGPSVEINYVLWNFGKREAQTEAARQALYAANYQFNQQIQDVVLATELAYFDFDAAEGFVAAAQATLDDANTSRKAASQRLSAGLGTKQEDLQASAQVSNAEYQLEVAQSQVETARAQLALSLGIPVTGNLNIERSQKLESSAKIDDDITNLMAIAMRQRPDLMAAYANVLESQHNVEAAKDDEKPRAFRDQQLELRLRGCRRDSWQPGQQLPGGPATVVANFHRV